MLKFPELTIETEVNAPIQCNKGQFYWNPRCGIIKMKEKNLLLPSPSTYGVA
jgi:hypothetical protein